MEYLSKAVAAGTLLFMLTSPAYAQNNDDDLLNNNQDPTSHPQTVPATPSMQNAAIINPQQAASQSNVQSTQPTQGNNTSIAITPEAIQWKSAPALLPPGAEFAVLTGNPKAKGVLTVRVKLPAHYQVAPLYMQNPAQVTILAGSINLGMGDKLDTNAGTTLPAGSFVAMPARKHHYFWTSDEAVVQISTKGPLLVTYVNPKDDPRKNKS